MRKIGANWPSAPDLLILLHVIVPRVGKFDGHPLHSCNVMSQWPTAAAFSFSRMLGLEARAIVSLFGRVVGTESPHPATPLEGRDDESRRLRIERRDPIRD